MVEQLCTAPDIFSIPVDLPQNPLRRLNAYVIRSEGEALVIDTGFNRPECHKALWAGIRELGLDLSRTSVFLTHLHSDHSGLAWDFVNRGCKIYMGRIDYAYLAAIKRGEVWPVMEKRFCDEGYPQEEISLQEEGNQGRRYAVDRIFPAELVEDGTELRVGEVLIRCVHTPGHTPGHMVLYLPEQKLLFSGDHILFDITPNISIWKDVEGSLASYLDSLQKICTLDVLRTFPAHRGAGESVYDRIQQIMEHHNQRLWEIFHTVQATPGRTAFEIAAKIKWSARGTPFDQFPPHQKWFAMGETLAHLDYLLKQGEIESTSNNGKIHYFALNKDVAGIGHGSKKEIHRSVHFSTHYWTGF